MSEAQQVKLEGAYSSPDNDAFSITHTLPKPASGSVSEKTQYLQKLRAAIASTQDEINKELTQRMEEDKVRLAAGGDGSKAVDDAKEEENYGEEVVEED